MANLYGQHPSWIRFHKSLYRGGGFALASMIAVPLGVICGLSEGMYRAINPIIAIQTGVSVGVVATCHHGSFRTLHKR